MLDSDITPITPLTGDLRPMRVQEVGIDSTPHDKHKDGRKRGKRHTNEDSYQPAEDDNSIESTNEPNVEDLHLSNPDDRQPLVGTGTIARAHNIAGGSLDVKV